jgi:hypothetical protein
MPGPVEKRILDPTRVRRVPPGFSWIDRRFLRDGWIERLERDEILLYLFLACVADKDGLSFYSLPRIAGTLRIGAESIEHARGRLVDLGLIAYEPPLYQVLSLGVGRRDPAEPRRVGDLLREWSSSSRSDTRRD